MQTKEDWKLEAGVWNRDGDWGTKQIGTGDEIKQA